MPKRSAGMANAACDAATALLNGGMVRIYSGTQPANVATAPTAGETVLAELTLANPAFAAAVNGVAAANAVTGDTSANASGTATWFRAFASGGTTAHLDGSVGTTGTDMTLNSTAISAGAAVNITGWNFTENM